MPGMRKLPKRMIRRSASAAFLLLALLVWAVSAPSRAQVAQDTPQGQVLGDVEMMMAGAEANRLDVVVHFLNKGIDPNASRGKGYTTLIVAAARGHTRIIDLLLARGADVNKTNDAGWSALMDARRACRPGSLR